MLGIFCVTQACALLLQLCPEDLAPLPARGEQVSVKEWTGAFMADTGLEEALDPPPHPLSPGH
jgi:hypothetical protein